MNTTAENQMTNRATVTFHTTPETKERLDRLAIVTRRSKSFLTNEAVEKFLCEEEAFVADVEEGLRDLEAGRTLTTAELTQSLHDHIEEVSGGRHSV